MKRVNVSGEVLIEPDGVIVPRVIRWYDGREWKVDRILHTCRSPDGEFTGTRYTVLIGGTEKYLYRDNTTWYVLVPDGEEQQDHENAR